MKMKKLLTRFLLTLAIGAAVNAAAMEENMSADPTWEITTLSNSLEIVELPYSGTGFETWSPVDRFIVDMGYFRTDLDDNGRSELQLYWYSRNPHFDGEDSEIRRYEDEETYLTSDPALIPVENRHPVYAGFENTQYLAFDSSNVMYRTILSNRHNSQEGHDPNHGWNGGLVKHVAIGEGSLIFDGLVQFVATDLDQPQGYADDVYDDKLVIWLHAIDEEGYPEDEDYVEGHTNLIVTAAFMNTFNEGNFVLDYVISCTNSPGGTPVPVDEATFVRPREWHRLTITAYEDISGTPSLSSDNWVGFSLKIDGVELSTGNAGGLAARSVGEHTVFESLSRRAKEIADRGSLFPSLVGNRDHADDIVGIGFQGCGACDDLTFSEGPVPPPEVNPELSDAETAAIVNGVRYRTFAEALAAAAAAGTAANPAVMQLVRDVTLAADDGTDSCGYGYAYFGRGWIVLDMNGHTLRGNASADMPYTLWIEGAHLTIENSGDGRDPEDLVLPIAGQSDAWYCYSGELAFDDGTPTPPAPKMLCAIGTARYETFADAMAAWNPDVDAEIELLDDVADANEYVISDYVVINLSGSTLDVDFVLAGPDTGLEVIGDGAFTGEVSADSETFPYADGWELYADAENGAWYFGEREFPKLLNADAVYSSANPYVIADRWDLQRLASSGAAALSKRYRQIADIDLDGIDWTGIGGDSRPFTGVYDGDGHAVVNLTLAKIGGEFNGFFRSFAGTLGNLRINLTGFSTNGTASVYSAGAVAAYASGTAAMTDVTVDGTVIAVGSVAAFGGLVKGLLTLENCENRLTQNIDYYGGESVAFVVTLGRGGRLIGNGGNRAHESLEVAGALGDGTVAGFETKTVDSSIATYEPAWSPIYVGGTEVRPEEVFDVANSAKPIEFSEQTTVVTNSAGKVQLVSQRGGLIEVPDCYDVDVAGSIVALTLNAEPVKPRIGSDDGAERAITVTDTEVTVRISNAYPRFYYRLVTKADVTDESWTPAGAWVLGSESGGALTVARDGDARVYAVQVTDVP